MVDSGQGALHKPTPALTTHHVLKLLAIFAMTIDHIGAYLYPDDLWWRVVGRTVMPIFLFLVGHALTYRMQRDVVLWAVVLMLLSPLLGEPVFSLNILVTILACQFLLAQVECRDWFTRCPWTLIVGCIVFWFPTTLLVEYGSVGFLYALMGYAVRSGRIHSLAGYAVAMLALAGHIGAASLSFDFTTPQMIGAIIGATGVTLLLVHFTHRPVTLVWISNGMQRAVRWLSRHSLQYYVVHRVLLQALGTATGVLSPAFRWLP